jgi:hypothetical protein
VCSWIQEFNRRENENHGSFIRIIGLQARVRPGSSQIQSRNVNHSTAVFLKKAEEGIL